MKKTELENENKKIKKKIISYRVASYLSIFLFLLLTIAFFLSYNMTNLIADFNGIENIDYSLVEHCEGNLQESAYCVNKVIKKIFNYNSPIKKLVYDFDEMLEEGVDCKHWSILYIDYMRYLGHDAKMVTMLDTGGGHAIAISFSSHEGYCILDQVNVECFKLQ